MLPGRICELFGIRYPIVQAGMANYAGPRLVAAVSNAGGLGLLGGVDRSIDGLERDIAQVRSATKQPFGVNIVLAEPHADKLDLLIAMRTPVISTSWGDPSEVIERAHAAGLLVVHQVETEDEAARVASSGPAALIAQGSDGGGHIGHVGTLALVPAVVDAAGGIPVLAAGGIADGRGLAAVIVLGAEGALIGTRFLATSEADIPDSWKQALVTASSSDAWMTDVPDRIWETHWPGATVRALANDLVRRWHDRPADLARNLSAVRDQFQAAERAGDARELTAFAGQSVGLIHEIVPAATLVSGIANEAERILVGFAERTRVE